MVAHLEGAHGTQVCRGTPVEKHCFRECTNVPVLNCTCAKNYKLYPLLLCYSLIILRLEWTWWRKSFKKQLLYKKVAEKMLVKLTPDFCCSNFAKRWRQKSLKDQVVLFFSSFRKLPKSEIQFQFSIFLQIVFIKRGFLRAWLLLHLDVLLVVAWLLLLLLLLLLLGCSCCCYFLLLLGCCCFFAVAAVVVIFCCCYLVVVVVIFCCYLVVVVVTFVVAAVVAWLLLGFFAVAAVVASLLIFFRLPLSF